MDGRYAVALIRARKAAERRYHRATHPVERRTALRELVALKDELARVAAARAEARR
jgi:hypothetical protein